MVVLTKFVTQSESHPRAARFALQAVARELLKNPRLYTCYRYRIPSAITVDLLYSPEEKRAHYKNLMKCGLQWICPLCASRMSEIKRGELSLALDNARQLFLPLMVTYTARHDANMPLRVLLEQMSDAYRYMRQRRLWQTYKSEYLIVGEARALEITYGDSGWHPHFHVIVFLDKKVLEYVEHDNVAGLVDLRASLRAALFPMWLAALRLQGLDATPEHGLEVTMQWDELSVYLAKFGSELPKESDGWTMAHEATKTIVKRAKKGGTTVWEMLLFHYCGLPNWGDLFSEYAKATKGKSILQYAPGLKAQLGLQPDDPGELLRDESFSDDILLGSFDADTWRVIVQAEAVGAIWDAANTGDPEKLAHVLKKVQSKVYLT